MWIFSQWQIVLLIERFATALIPPSIPDLRPVYDPIRRLIERILLLAILPLGVFILLGLPTQFSGYFFCDAVCGKIGVLVAVILPPTPIHPAPHAPPTMTAGGLPRRAVSGIDWPFVGGTTWRSDSCLTVIDSAISP